jgi:PEP-CTERM motif
VTPFSKQGANLFATGIMDLTYSLDGVAQAVTLDSVEFETNGFALVFDNQTKLDFVGADLGSDGTVDVPTWGSYAVFVLTLPRIAPSIRTTFAAVAPQQIGTVMVVTTGSVPEPASWTLLIVGFGATGAALRQRRRRPAEARGQPASCAASPWNFEGRRSVTTTPAAASAWSPGAQHT